MYSQSPAAPYDMVMAAAACPSPSRRSISLTTPATMRKGLEEGEGEDGKGME